MNRRSFLKMLAALPVIGVCFKDKSAVADEPTYNLPRLPGGRSRWYAMLQPKPPGAICPACGSEDVGPVIVCNDCGGHVSSNGGILCDECGGENIYHDEVTTRCSNCGAEWELRVDCDYSKFPEYSEEREWLGQYYTALGYPPEYVKAVTGLTKRNLTI